MFNKIANFFARSPYQAISLNQSPEQEKEFKRKKWSVFIAITFGYSFFYVCRLSINVVKGPMIEEGIFTAAQLGIIGSGLYFAYAFGKLVNGILADRANIKRFMTLGLFITALLNLVLGFTSGFAVFVVLWALSGWFQSMGAPSSIVSIAHWYDDKNRGSAYGVWSCSHSVGEAITYIGTALVVATFGWVWGFRIAGLIGIIAACTIYKFLYEDPRVYGHPSPAVTRQQKSLDKSAVKAAQLEVLKNPAVWIIALASAFFYITRYAVNSWGIFFLQSQKGYSLVEAGTIIGISPIVGIVGTFLSGFFSDKFFSGQRNTPALLFAVIYSLAIAAFVYGPANWYVDSLSMAVFGLSLGVLLCYLGGLMVVDICSKEAAGMAVGVVGVMSYLGAALQEIISGNFITNSKTIVNGVAVYDFSDAGLMWVGASLVSLLLIFVLWSKPYSHQSVGMPAEAKSN